MLKKVSAMYFSPTGTSEKAVKAISKALAKELDIPENYINVTLPQPREEKYSFTGDEIFILGLPVYGGRIPSAIEGFVSSLKGENTLAVAVCVYGNRDYDDALLEMKTLLSERGFNVVAAGAFIGEHSFSRKLASDRPDAADIEIAEGFGRDIASRIKAIAKGESIGDFEVKGNFPYRERGQSNPISPDTTDKCTSCMICAKACPTGAISTEDPSEADAGKCIRCCACIKACPESAKFFSDPSVPGAAKWLEDNFMDRKEPDMFM